jgi:DNA-binding NtrC family response regulator
MDSTKDVPLELLAESMRVIAGITVTTNRRCARQYFEQAVRIFDAVGNATARDEVLRESNEALGVAIDGSRVPVKDTNLAELESHSERESRPAAASLTERIASLLQLAPVPSLFAEELLSLLSDTGAVVRAKVVKIAEDRQDVLDRHSSPGANGRDVVQIRVGSHGGYLLDIIAQPIPTPAARATLLAIETIVRAARVLARAQQLKREQGSLWPKDSPEQQLGLIYSSERMRQLVNNVRTVAPSNIPVLLTGETGVGKELFARALHQASTRSDRTFLPFNCSTVARDMFDSQLFGHRRGSFTGANEDSPGVIRAAAGGTLFLDEIGEMSLDAQPKLLRFLESGEILPLGEQKPRLVDVRVVAATNAKLDQLVGEGKFREDLFYRLDVIRIEIPPLRERREEIPALVGHFLERFGREQQKPLLRVADETLEYLVLYNWPGNVRQLANEIRRIVALAEPGSVVMPAHLSERIAASRRTIPVETPPRQSTEVVTRLDQPLAAAVEHIERAAIQRAIAITEGHLDEAAKVLGLSRKGLYLKRQRLKLE